MKTMTTLQAALAALVLLAGCGPGGSLPTEPQQNPDPGGENPPPVDPPPAPQSLWPLTKDSTWTYDITDYERGGIKYDKVVTVKGPSEVPGTNGTQAIQVESVQALPTGAYTELSWQQETNGLVTRLREEDRRGSELLRVTVWSPATLKSLSALQNVDWSYTQGAVTEKIAFGDGTVTEEPEKPYRWRVTAVNESVTVPAGTFPNALRVERDRSDKTVNPRIYWLVPGVGKVKEDGDEKLEELRSYSVK